jgi:hypothetical protein
MLSTPCHACCFRHRQQKGCAAGQYCVEAGETVAAPGFCRLSRPAQWARKQLNGHPSVTLDNLVERALQEADLKFDLMILFDERVHDRAKLGHTLSCMGCASEQNIVVDMTGSDRRQGIAIDAAQTFRERPLMVECLVDGSASSEEAVDVAVRLVAAPYFAVVEAGRQILGLDRLKAALRDTMSRAVSWHFPMRMGCTAMVAPRSGLGVYLTAAFRQLSGNRGKPFWKKLHEYEERSGWSLSWLFDRGELV